MIQATALVYVPADKSLVACKKSQLSLRGPFLPLKEADLPWKDKDGGSTKYVSTILRTSVKGEI